MNRHTTKIHATRYRFCACLLLVAAASFAGESTDSDDSIPTLLDLYATHSKFPLSRLTPDELGDLLAQHAIVKVSGAPLSGEIDELIGMGVYGLKIVEAPRLLLWLAVMGGNDERDRRLTTAMLSRGDAGSYLRYQHIDLPWPVRDRHWVIHCEKNPRIAKVSDGLIWEHRWQLRRESESPLAEALQQRRVPGLTPDDVSDAIYLPENQGAWTMIDLGSHRTLVIAYLDVDLGGRFPGPLVRRFARANLKAGLESLQELGARVHLNYAEERPIHDGFGELISVQEAEYAADTWQTAQRLALLR